MKIKLFVIAMIMMTGGFVYLALMPQITDRYRVAIVTPTTHPSLEQIEKGFVETLSSSSSEKYVFKTYNAQANKTLMRSEIEEISRQHYDLIFTIGASASQMCKEVMDKKHDSTPIVFTAISQPMKLNIIESEKNSNNQVTGVKEGVDFRKQLNLLQQLCPNTKSILLIYDPTQYGLVGDKQQVEAILHEMRIKLVPIEVFKTSEIMQKITPFLSDADAIFVLKDNTVVPGLDLLVKLSQRHRIPLVVSDLDSVDKGAVMAFGVSEYTYGVEAAIKAKKILEEGRLPKEIPVTAPSPDSFQFKFNSKRLSELGIQFQPKLGEAL